MKPLFVSFVELLTAVLCVAAPVLIAFNYRFRWNGCGGRSAQDCDTSAGIRESPYIPISAACILQWIVAYASNQTYPCRECMHTDKT